MIAALQSRPCQPFGRPAVGLDQQRRETLPASLIPESVDEIFRRELIRRIRLVAQKIANRVVVLAVGQTAKLGFGPRCLSGAAGFLLAESSTQRQGPRPKAVSTGGSTL